MFFSACRDFFYVYFCRRIATPHSEPGSEKAGQRFQKIKKLKNQKIMKKTNNIFNIRVGKQPWLGQTGMETATKLTADDVLKVMKKYNIFIV